VFNTKRIHHVIGVVDGSTAVAIKQGSVTLTVHQQNGTKSIVTLHGCKYLPGLSNNLFSIATAPTKGWKLSNKGIYIVLQHNNGKIVFDIPNRSIYGLVMYARMVPIIGKAMNMKMIQVQPLIMSKHQINSKDKLKSLANQSHYNDNVTNQMTTAATSPSNSLTSMPMHLPSAPKIKSKLDKMNLCSHSITQHQHIPTKCNHKYKRLPLKHLHPIKLISNTNIGQNEHIQQKAGQTKHNKFRRNKIPQNNTLIIRPPPPINKNQIKTWQSVPLKRSQQLKAKNKNKVDTNQFCL
jgi:hypothetical protein